MKISFVKRNEIAKNRIKKIILRALTEVLLLLMVEFHLQKFSVKVALFFSCLTNEKTHIASKVSR